MGFPLAEDETNGGTPAHEIQVKITCDEVESYFRVTSSSTIEQDMVATRGAEPDGA